MEFLDEEFHDQDYGDIDETVGESNEDLKKDVDNNEQIRDDNATAFGESNEDPIEDVEKPIDAPAPALSMIFNTEEDAYKYYNSYAKTIGFSVRKNRVNKKKNGMVWKRQYTCSREGFYKKKNTPTRKRDDRRCGCEAELEIRLQNDEKFVVTAFHSEHNHDLVSPSNSHALRSHRNVQSSQGGFMTQMSNAGFKPSEIYRYMTVEAGGHQNLNFSQTDCNNFIQRERAKLLKKGDANNLLAYFKKKKVEDDSFFYEIRTNEENEICGCFYCDGRSRQDYVLFGDVVAFDTTFKTNNYDMVCAPIIGINHHGQTILFGCGLLDGETTDACTWLFDVFVQAMRGKKPKTIFTDQAASIAAAVKEVFPNSHHRLCLWHIFQNAAKHLGHVFQEFSTFSQAFRSCVYDPETIEEFMSSWNSLLEDYRLSGNTWLESLYDLREKWAQVYGRSNFCAGMTTTQRSESINKFLKKFFSKNLYLCEWVQQYDLALEDRREKERLAEVATSQTKRIFLSNWAVEVEAAKRYTKNIFYVFQGEYKKCLDLKLKLESDDGIVQRYVVERPGNPFLKRSLTYSPSNQSIVCSCKRFKFEGILCSHALKLFRELALTSLPSAYYIKRWRHDAKQGVQSSGLNVCAPSSSSTVQYSRLSQIAQRILAKGSKDNKTCTWTESKLLELETVLDGNSQVEQGHEELDIENEMHENNTNLVLRDPKKKRKARRTGKWKNVLGAKRQRKRSDESMQKEQNAVLDDENTAAAPKKRRGSSKRKGTEESNSKEDNMNHLIPQQHGQVQGSKKQSKRTTQPVTNEQNAALLNVDITTQEPKRKKVSSKKKDIQESNSNRHKIVRPSNSHPPYSQEPFGPGDVPYQPHVYQVGASSSQIILNQVFGYQEIPPTLGDYSIMHSQEIVQSRSQGSTRLLNFEDPSMSKASLL